MKRILLYVTVSVWALMQSVAYGQDVSQPVGWCTQGGGVTGGGTAAPVTVANYADFKTALLSSTVKMVYISGTITIPAGGRIDIKDQSDKTIFGLPGSKIVSTDMSKTGSGIFYMTRCVNFIMRNLVLEGPGAYDTDGYDNMCLDNCQRVWIDHCEFHDGMDGNLDLKNMSDYLSITWCTFSYEKPPKAGGPGGAADHRYTSLIGSSDGATADEGKLRITFQYCWWGEGCRERMPRIRYGKLHLINNLFSSSVSNHCIRAGYKADVLAEGNYFDDQNLPIDEYEKNYTAIRGVNNYGAADIIKNTAFVPPYTLAVTAPANIVAPIKSCAGAKLPSLTGVTACGNGNTNKFPTVTLTAPVANADFDLGTAIQLSATAADADGSIADVAFYQGTTLLNTDNSSAYGYLWTPTVAGTYVLKAVAKDNLGATTTSTTVTITVTDRNVNKLPTVSLTAPAANADFDLGTAISLAATAADADGSIASVTFYQGTTLLNTDNMSAYAYSWTPAAAGTYVLTAVAKDNLNATTTSTAVTITVTDRTKPTLTATNNTTQTVKTNVAIVPMVFTWGSAATGVTYTTLPTGLTGAIDNTAKTLTVGGMPSVAGQFTVTTQGGIGSVVLPASVLINTSADVVLANWYPFQETAISLGFVSFTDASVLPTFMDVTKPANGVAYTTGALRLTKAIGKMTLTLNSLASLKVRMYATGTRTMAVTYGPTGTEFTWNSPSYASGAAELDLTALIPALVSSTPIIVNIINSRTDGGSYYIHDLYVEGTEGKVAPVAVKQTIALEAGWNLFSFYTQPTDASIAAIFAGLDVKEIKDQNSFWNVNNASYLNTIQTLSPGTGYLVYMNAAADLSITGIAIAEGLAPLKTGLNLVASPSQQLAPVATYINANICTEAKNFEGYWLPDGSGNLDTFSPGEAYFIVGQ